MLIRRPKKQEKFGKLCNQLEGFDEGRHQIFVPDINKSHYSVIDIIIDKKSNYIMKVLYYDCLLRPKMKSLTSKNVPARIKKFIHNFIRVFNKFVLKIKNHSCDESKVLKKVVQVSCPVQQNGIDCRLFAVASCLHIFEGTQLGPHIFTQYEIMKLRTLLPRLLGKNRNERYHPYIPHCDLDHPKLDALFQWRCLVTC